MVGEETPLGGQQERRLHAASWLAKGVVEGHATVGGGRQPVTETVVACAGYEPHRRLGNTKSGGPTGTLSASSASRYAAPRVRAERGAVGAPRGPRR